MPILLDAARPIRAGRLGVPTLAAGTLAVLAALGFWRAQSATVAELESAIRAASRPAPAVAPRSDPTSLARARWVVRELGVPWPRLFEALESARTPAIRVLSIDAGSTTGQVAIKGQARHLADVLEFAERLRGQALSEVMIRSHQPLADAGERPLGFHLVARWNADRDAGPARVAGAQR